jgi:hypothetical protein
MGIFRGCYKVKVLRFVDTLFRKKANETVDTIAYSSGESTLSLRVHEARTLHIADASFGTKKIFK